MFPKRVRAKKVSVPYRVSYKKKRVLTETSTGIFSSNRYSDFRANAQNIHAVTLM